MVPNHYCISLLSLVLRIVSSLYFIGVLSWVLGLAVLACACFENDTSTMHVNWFYGCLTFSSLEV